MCNEAMITTITELARQIFKQPNLNYSPDQVFAELLGFDSVLAVQYVLAIEQAFGVTLHDYEVDRMHTMGDVVKVLQAKPVSGAEPS
jgi:acyl carrier protein